MIYDAENSALPSRQKKFNFKHVFKDKTVSTILLLLLYFLLINTALVSIRFLT